MRMKIKSKEKGVCLSSDLQTLYFTSKLILLGQKKLTGGSTFGIMIKAMRQKSSCITKSIIFY